jgi:hypothetical protein
VLEFLEKLHSSISEHIELTVQPRDKGMMVMSYKEFAQWKLEEGDQFNCRRIIYVRFEGKGSYIIWEAKEKLFQWRL